MKPSLLPPRRTLSLLLQWIFLLVLTIAPLGSCSNIFRHEDVGSIVLDQLLQADNATPNANNTNAGVRGISRTECESQGGQVISDIGNGAIFQPEYVCENSGQPPTDAVVVAPQNDNNANVPMPIEGEVCCSQGAGLPSMTNRPEISRQECEAKGEIVGIDFFGVCGRGGNGRLLNSNKWY